MSWQEPNDRPTPKKTPDGPPDLEAMLRQLSQSFFGGGKPKGGGPNVTSSNNPWPVLGLVAGLVALLYVLSGIYIVQPAEQGIITQFGRYTTSVGPGPHWVARGIQNNQIVNTESAHTSRHGGLMLTRDENIVQVEIAVQYRIDNPKAYLFHVDGPEHSLKQVTDSALRYVVGHSTLDEVLTTGRTQIAAAVREQIREAIAVYQTGLVVLEVAMQPATPPEEVKSAFDDVIRAQEDEQSLLNGADAYARKVEPKAQGQARRILEEAQAYQESQVLKARGESERFKQIVGPYQADPELFKTRRYLEVMTQVMGQTRKLIVDPHLKTGVYLWPGDHPTTGPVPNPQDVLEDEEESQWVRNSLANTPQEPPVRATRRSRHTHTQGG